MSRRIAHCVTRFFCRLLAALCCGAALSAGAAASERIALVIGNAAYESAPLENSARDAKAVAQALRSLGFTVVERIDADRELWK